MTDSQFETIDEQLKKDYENASFEIVEGKDVPDLEDIQTGKAVKLEKVGYSFFDLRGFTRWSRTKRDKTVFKVLQPTLAALTRAVRYSDGTIEKPTGDGLMTILGAQEPNVERAAVLTLQSAIDMVTTLEFIVNPFMKSKKHIDNPLEWGIGLEMGDALIAKVGIRNHHFLTSISKAANHAAKLEDAAPSGKILLGEKLRDALPEKIREKYTVRHGMVHDMVAYEFTLPRDSEGKPHNTPNLLTTEDVKRLNLGGLILGSAAVAIAALGIAIASGASKPHRFYGEN
jgi:class 3 adenylate cyclase